MNNPRLSGIEIWTFILWKRLFILSPNPAHRHAMFYGDCNGVGSWSKVRFVLY